VLGALMKRYPADYRLVKALGLFNYERSERFPDKNLDSTLYIGPLEEARGHGESDCLSLSYLGSAYLARKDGAKAFKCFEDCIKINPDNPGAHFKLAIIHNAAHRFNEALLEAKATYEELSKAQYGNGEAVRQARAEAARMTGVLQADLGDEKAARESFRAALAAYSEDALSRQYLFDTELTLGLRKEAVATATSFFAQSPKAQETYDRLIGIFKRHEALDDLQKLFDVAIGGYKDDWEVLGELHFHKGEVDVLKGEIDEARKQFEQARTCFLHVFKEGHNVYKVIDDLVAKLSGKPQ
jgi:tetratricopeptide (TPR) repeat protein